MFDCLKRTAPLALFSLAFLTQAAHATTVIPRSTDQLVSSAAIVVYGRVVQIEVDAKSGFRTALIESRDTARAPEEFKSVRDFLVPLENRAIPNSSLVEKVASAPEFGLGEDVVVFLHAIPVDREGIRRRVDGKRIFALDGFHQGKLRVFEDVSGVRRVLPWNVMPEMQPSFADLRHQKTEKRISAFGKTARFEKNTPELVALDGLLNSVRATAVQR